jgi:hypothetical protein
MTKITQDQALERWDTLPQILREALYSDVDSDYLWKVCEGEYIPDEKIYTISGIVGYVLMGFLHPEDVGGEIAEKLQIDRRIADVIASAINQRIFAPLRPEIDKVYSPASASPVLNVASAGGPIMMSVVPTVVPISSKKGVPPPQPPAPLTPSGIEGKPLPEKGWSTMRPAFAEASAGKPSEIPPMPPKVTMKTDTKPVPMPLSQVPAKIPVGMPTPAAMPAPRPSFNPPINLARPAVPAPMMPITPKPMPAMMVQRDNVPQPIKNAPDLNAASRNIGNIMPGGISAPSPLRPVVFEMSGPTIPNIGSMGPDLRRPSPSVFVAAAPRGDERNRDYGKTGAAEGVKVVHYSDLKSSLPVQFPLTDKPPVAEKGRQVTEMTIGGQAAQISKPTQNSTPETIMAKPGMMSAPMARPMPATFPVKSSAPMPMTSPMKPPMPIPAPMPIPQKPMSQQIPAAIPPKPAVPSPSIMTVPKPASGKVIVMDFKEGK